MRYITDYIVIQDSNIEYLRKYIIEYNIEGYELQGGISTMINPHLCNTIFFIQAMVRYEEI